MNLELGWKINRNFWIILSIIVLLAFGIRLWGIQQGLPQIQWTDENADLSTALRLLNGELPARHVRYHRSLIAYVNLGAVGGLFATDFLTGQVSSTDQFRSLYFSDRAQFTYATRFIMAILTSLSVGMIGLAGRYINQNVGLLAAALLFANGLYALHSLYALPDTLIGFSIALCLWLTLRAWRFGRPRDYFWLGISIALVMLSKLNASTVAIGIVVAQLGMSWQQANGDVLAALRGTLFTRNWLWLLLGIIIGNGVFNPIAFLYPSDLIWEIQNLNNHAFGSSSSFLERIQITLTHIWGIIPVIWRWTLVPSVIGIIEVFRRRLTSHWIVLITFLFVMLTIASVSTNFYRASYWIPWVVCMALLGGIGLDAIAKWLTAARLSWLGWGAVILLLVLEAGFMLNILSKKTAADTRQLALAYVHEEVDADANILVGDVISYSVPLQRNERSINQAVSLGAPMLEIWRWWLGQTVESRPAPAYAIFGPEWQQQLDTFDDINALVEQEQITYVIDEDYCGGSPKRPVSNSALEFPALSDQMRQDWELVAVFSPFTTDSCAGVIDPRLGLTIDDSQALDQQIRSGPIIRIYRTNE
jgi:Dolichyl-phosphate-mannose-protein mannosyltransferase